MTLQGINFIRQSICAMWCVYMSASHTHTAWLIAYARVNLSLSLADIETLDALQGDKSNTSSIFKLISLELDG
jgi:hypothetical protein